MLDPFHSIAISLVWRFSPWHLDAQSGLRLVLWTVQLYVVVYARNVIFVLELLLAVIAFTLEELLYGEK